MTERFQVRVEGRVQGVGFRWAARRQAVRLGLAGFVHNEPDGSVLLEVEGEAQAVSEFLAWCHHGPPPSVVTAVKTIPLPVRNQKEFRIEHEA